MDTNDLTKKQAANRPKEVGLTLWFALGALVAAVVAYALELRGISALLVLLTLLWGVTGAYRAVRVHQWVQARNPA